MSSDLSGQLTSGLNNQQGNLNEAFGVLDNFSLKDKLHFALGFIAVASVIGSFIDLGRDRSIIDTQAFQTVQTVAKEAGDTADNIQYSVVKKLNRAARYNPQADKLISNFEIEWRDGMSSETGRGWVYDDSSESFLDKIEEINKAGQSTAISTDSLRKRVALEILNNGSKKGTQLAYNQ